MQRFKGKFKLICKIKSKINYEWNVYNFPKKM